MSEDLAQTPRVRLFPRYPSHAAVGLLRAVGNHAVGNVMRRRVGLACMAPVRGLSSVVQRGLAMDGEEYSSLSLGSWAGIYVQDGDRPDDWGEARCAPLRVDAAREKFRRADCQPPREQPGGV